MSAEIAPGVYWVGVTDWGIRRFHGFELSTHRGTTYNSFIIKDEKTVLVDTVWDRHQNEFLDKVREVVDPAKIDYVVANHGEPDHSGCLPAIMRLCPNATVVVSKSGASSIPGHYHEKWKFLPVKTGDHLKIGKNELVFVEAPLLHWPDSMFTYLTGHNILMPNDAFGQHYASSDRFVDQAGLDPAIFEATKYYANIVTP
ncbi:MAG: MBL fold metallo-hydrolase, partial [bacterium]